MKFKKDKIITCTFNMGVYSSLDVHLQPANKFIPSWWKSIPRDINEEGLSFPVVGKEIIPNGRTVKYCPSFADIFNLGYVLPAPVDMWFSVAKDNYDINYWKIANEAFEIELHHDSQMIQHINSPIKKVFKFVNPIQIIGPPGYSLMQLPMFYHYDQMDDWYVPYGVIDIDVHHEVNPQIFYVSDKDEVYIKAGTPLCYYIPFKRTDTKVEMKPMDEELKNKVIKSQYLAHRSFSKGYFKKRKYDI